MTIRISKPFISTLLIFVFCCLCSIAFRPTSVLADDLTPTANQLEKFNRTLFDQSADPRKATANYELFKTPRGIITVFLPYLFTFSGIILFVMLLWGGFEMLTGAANSKAQEAGKARITAAIIGFLLIFASYWLAQILQIVFGISILK